MKGENKNMHFGAPNFLFKRAEDLRKFCTWEEEIMWGCLSGNKLGVKFRRQHPLLFYIADFYCHQLKLVIEIDGSIHNKEDIKINDAIRQREIEELGISVLRFINSQVKNEIAYILKQINKKIEELKSIETPSSPLGAGGSLRFSNSQIKNNPEIILEQINKKIEELKSIETPSSPSGAGGLSSFQ